MIVSIEISPPDDWAVETLGAICDLRQEQVAPSASNATVYVGLEHIEPGNPTLIAHGSPSDVNSAKSRFHVGDLLYGKLRPYLDKAVLTRSDGICSTDILVLTPNTRRSMGQFIVNVLHTAPFVQHAIRTTHGVNHPRTSWQSIREFELFLPPLAEQRAIAKVLDTIQATVTAQQTIIDRTVELKAALMAKLFTEGISGELTLRSEVGLIPKHWRIARLGDVAKIGNGSTPKRDRSTYWEGGKIPWLTSAKIHETIINEADEFVTDVAKSECHLPLVRARSLLVAITGQGKTLGNAALVTFDTCISQHLAYILLNQPDELLAEYVLFYLQTQYRRFRQVGQSGGTTKGALTCAFLRSYPVPIPPIEEQHEIANVLGAIDQAGIAAVRRKRLYSELFSAMLGELMIGRIRIGDLSHTLLAGAD